MDIIKSIESKYIKEKQPKINIGNTVKVSIRIKEGNKERLQAFEGIVIKKKGTGVNETFTVRKIGAHGVGVERTFLVNSPKVEKVEVTKIGKVRRAKLYYLRDRVGKRAKLREDLYAMLKYNAAAKEEAEAEALKLAQEEAEQARIKAEEEAKAAAEAEANAEATEEVVTEATEETVETEAEKVEE